MQMSQDAVYWFFVCHSLSSPTERYYSQTGSLTLAFFLFSLFFRRENELIYCPLGWCANKMMRFMCRRVCVRNVQFATSAMTLFFFSSLASSLPLARVANLFSRLGHLILVQQILSAQSEHSSQTVKRSPESCLCITFFYWIWMLSNCWTKSMVRFRSTELDTKTSFIHISTPIYFRF